MAEYEKHKGGYSLNIDLEAKPIINDADMKEFKNKVNDLKQSLDFVVSLDTENISSEFNNLALTQILGENNEQLKELKETMIEAERLSKERELALKAIKENENLDEGLKLDDETIQSLKDIVKEIEGKTELFDKYKKITGTNLLKESKPKSSKSFNGGSLISSLFKKGGFAEELKTQLAGAIGGVGGQIAAKVVGVFEKIAKKIGEFIKQTFEDAIAEIKEIASYSLETSTTFNETAWNDMINYGMSGQQSYAYENALEKVNLQGKDIADVAMYLQAMPELAATFQDYYNDYLESYEQNLELAQAYQEFQTSWEEFKTEFMQDIMEFFSKNKYTIMAVLKGLMSALETILDVVSAILSILPGSSKTVSERTQAALDVLGVSSSTTNNSSVSTTITQQNTYTSISNNEQNALENQNQAALLELVKTLN